MGACLKLVQKVSITFYNLCNNTQFSLIKNTIFQTKWNIFYQISVSFSNYQNFRPEKVNFMQGFHLYLDNNLRPAVEGPSVRRLLIIPKI